MMILIRGSVIFSCWTKTLDLIARHLRQHSIPFERIDGECPLHRRQQVLDDFATNPNMPVLIMTTGTGAYGLVLSGKFQNYFFSKRCVADNCKQLEPHRSK
jgi:SNF2 family DNA or RNA helicase